MAGPRKATSKDEGKDDGALKGARILVVEGRYYDEIADELLAGAKRALDAAKVDYDVATVPGALEVPQAIALILGDTRLPGILLGPQIPGLRGRRDHSILIHELLQRLHI